MNRKMRRIICIAIVVAALLGAAFLAYPAAAYWWNSMTQRKVIENYNRVVQEADTQGYDEALAAADAYNAELAKTGVNWDMSEEEMAAYESLLDVTDTGMMGYIQIPKIGVALPIYHGTDNDVMKEAIGHIAGTSLPVGGTGTHCSVSGHRGLPSPRLLADIGELEYGDVFSVTVPGRELYYEVDQIRTVTPMDLGDLAIDPQKDYFTIVTCTPYGVNTHRLLIRGHRIDSKPNIDVMANAVQVRPRLVVAFIAGLVVIAALVVVGISVGRRIKKAKELAKSEQGNKEPASHEGE